MIWSILFYKNDLQTWKSELFLDEKQVINTPPLGPHTSSEDSYPIPGDFDSRSLLNKKY